MTARVEVRAMGSRHGEKALRTKLRALSSGVAAAFVLSCGGGAWALQAASPSSSSPETATIAGLPASGDLDAGALLALARLSESFKPDGFSADPANAYAGRSFVARLDKPSYSYNPDTHILTASSGPSNWIIVQGKTGTSYAEGQNAFGVKAIVKTESFRTVEVKSQDFPLPASRLIRDQMHYQVHLPLDTEAARELSTHLAWIVAGKLIRPKRFDGQLGNVVTIDDGAVLATIATPITTKSHTVDLNAIVKNVSLIDTRTGKVLSSEDLPPCPVANAMQAAECAASQRHGA